MLDGPRVSEEGLGYEYEVGLGYGYEVGLEHVYIVMKNSDLILYCVTCSGLKKIL